MPKLQRHVITVMGRYPFPHDMLRYDECFPATEADSNRINQVADGLTMTKEEASTRSAFIQLVHYGDHRWTPTFRRWQSFSWAVVTHNNHQTGETVDYLRGAMTS